jgi:hypothetical protein
MKESKAQPESSWIDVRAVMHEEHLETLENELLRYNSCDVTYHPRIVLSIEELTEAQRLVMHVLFPRIGFFSQPEADFMIEDAGRFAEIEEAIENHSIDVPHGRIAIAEIALSDESIFNSLAANLAKCLSADDYVLQRE